MRAEQLTGPVARHGEGPAWSPRWAGVRWVDMLQGDLLELTTDGAVRRRHVGRVACLQRARQGAGFVVADERGLLVAAADDLDAPLHRVVDLLDDPTLRLNEGGCAPDGTCYVGSMAYDQAPGRGRLWSVDASGRVREVIAAVTVSNGIAWSPDGHTAYYADTPTGRVDRCSWSGDRGLHDRRPFVRVQAPDGICTDAEGGVWVARYGGGCVQRYTAEGALDAVVELPTAYTTAVAFTGPQLDRLVVTTSSLEAHDDPRAGCLYTADVGIGGLPLTEFAG